MDKSAFSLTNEQSSARDWKKSGSLLIIAGPGSGKTTTLLARLASTFEEHQKLKKEKYQRYVVLSFVKNTVKYLQNKFQKDYPDFCDQIKSITSTKESQTSTIDRKSRPIEFKTVHSWARSILRKHKQIDHHLFVSSWKLSSKESEGAIDQNVRLFLNDKQLNVNEKYGQNCIFHLIDAYPKAMSEAISRVRGNKISHTDEEVVTKNF